MREGEGDAKDRRCLETDEHQGEEDAGEEDEDEAEHDETDGAATVTVMAAGDMVFTDSESSALLFLRAFETGFFFSEMTDFLLRDTKRPPTLGLSRANFWRREYLTMPVFLLLLFALYLAIFASLSSLVYSPTV